MLNREDPNMCDQSVKYNKFDRSMGSSYFIYFLKESFRKNWQAEKDISVQKLRAMSVERQ